MLLFFLRETTTAAAAITLLVILDTIILTRMFSQSGSLKASIVAYNHLSNGSYYYQNTNGSTYYNSGTGYSQYTSPSPPLLTTPANRQLSDGVRMLLPLFGRKDQTGCALRDYLTPRWSSNLPSYLLSQCHL